MIDDLWLIELAARGSVILLLAGLATAFLRTAAWRHLVWSCALGALIFLPLLMQVLPPIALPLLPAAERSIAGVLSSAAPGALPATTADPVASASPDLKPARPVADRTSWPAPAPRAGAMVADGSWFEIWWVVGALICLALGADRLRRHRLLRRARTLESPPWRRDLERSSRLSRSVRLLTSPDVDVPVTWGLLRPILLLPAGAEVWSGSRRRHVLIHELAHVERCDTAILALAQLACALHWFNPLAWFALHRLVREGELAADDQVLLAGVKPSSYAGDLVDFARGLRRPLPRSVGAMARSHLPGRVAAILDGCRVRGALRPVRAALVLAFAGLVVLPATAALRPERRPGYLPGLLSEAVQVAADAETSAPSPTPVTPVTAATPVAPPAPAAPAAPASGVHGLLAECGESKGASIHSENDELRLSVRSERCELRIESEGEIEYAADDSGIVRLARGARLEIDERRSRKRRQLTVTAGTGGAPEHEWVVDGERRPFDAEGQAWLAQVLPEIFRATGLNADQRVARILAAQGVAGVLAEIDLIRSDYVGRIYLTLLLEQGQLDSGELRSWLELAGRTVGSDYELAETLVGLPAARLGEPGIGEAFVAAAETIGSDYELRRTLAALLNATTPTRATLDRILAAALTIGSDYELAELLIRVADVYPPGEPLPTSYHRAADSIGSDYELRRALSKSLERPLEQQGLVDLLRTARTIGSDYELAELLVAVGRSQRVEGAARDAFVEALETVGSEYEHRRAAEVLARRPG